MCYLEQFDIDLKALTEATTALEWQLDNQFFNALEEAQVQGGSLHVSGSIRKTVGFFELSLHTGGTVRVPCDRCLEMMDQPVEADLHLIVRLGNEYQEGDDTVTVSEDEGILHTAWFIYESIALAVPIQHVHQPGDCNDAMMRVLNEHSAARSSDADANETDPRWDALKKLKN
ncbi:MAG: DUF177 domain-containing protein [Prevotella sp.]|nr:DUF177 domain-containing protein [Prevotella sp.]